MYKLQLIRKYLFKRRIAWVALIAVMLCTAMVLVVISVMGGWLNTFKESFHGMNGDVVVSGNSLAGFPYYGEMIDKIKKVPGVVAAEPVIRTGGLINLDNRQVLIVQVIGYTPTIGDAIEWPQSLHRQNKEHPGKPPSFDLVPGVKYERYVPAKLAGSARNRAGIIVTGALVGLTHDVPEAEAEFRRHNLYRLPVTLTLLPVSLGESIDRANAVPVPSWIVDDSRSRIYQLDYNDVYMSFDEAQKDLRMAATESGDPAKCSEIEIKTAPGADLKTVRDKVQAATEQVRAGHFDYDWYGMTVMTWQEQQGDFINAIEHEVVLTTVLYGIMSIVAVLLIFCIFYMIVMEKTKDIGILKSVGATGTGILGLFLGYGLAIGVIGAGLGFLTAFYFVKYINELHGWMAARLGVEIWSPKTYQFDRIPSEMNARTVAWVMTASIASALAGALLPAIRAAGMSPVDALRYE